MRMVAAILVGASLLLQAGCNARPPKRSSEARQSPTKELYRSLAAAFAPCSDAAKKTQESGYRISTATADLREGYRAAGGQVLACNQAADAMLKLGATSLPSERADALAQTTIQVCVSEAVSKSAGGDAYKQRLGKSGRSAKTDEDSPEKVADDPAMNCTIALTNFEKFSEMNL